LGPHSPASPSQIQARNYLPALAPNHRRPAPRRPARLGPNQRPRQGPAATKAAPIPQHGGLHPATPQPPRPPARMGRQMPAAGHARPPRRTCPVRGRSVVPSRGRGRLPTFRGNPAPVPTTGSSPQVPQGRGRLFFLREARPGRAEAKERRRERGLPCSEGAGVIRGGLTKSQKAKENPPAANCSRRRQRLGVPPELPARHKSAHPVVRALHKFRVAEVVRRRQRPHFRPRAP